MICPVCRREMENHSYKYYGLADWDLDYPASYHEEYRCSKCKTVYQNGGWEIPDIYRATNKQVSCCRFIENVLGLKAPPPAKIAMWSFINNHLKEATEEAEKLRIEDLREHYSGISEENFF